VRGTAIVLSQEEYRTVWHGLGLGTRHWNMELPGLPELTEDERRARVGSTLEGLRARGLVDRRGPAPEVEDALRLLANPLREISGSVHAGADQVRLLAGSRDDRAVLALLDDHHLLVRTYPAAKLCTAVARQFPDRPAGPGSSVSVPTDLLAQPADGGNPGLTGHQLENRLIRGGIKPADARSFAIMVRGSKTGGGKFGAARRDRNGTRHPAGITLVYFATEQGGYTLQQLRGAGGTAWTTLAPATAVQLAQRLDQLLDGIRTG
jgi:EspG family